MLLREKILDSKWYEDSQDSDGVPGEVSQTKQRKAVHEIRFRMTPLCP